MKTGQPWRDGRLTGGRKASSRGSASTWATSRWSASTRVPTQETTSFGNGTVETVSYDQRLQPTSRTVPGVLGLTASFSGPSGRNNGNVFQVADSYDATGNFTYTYDYLNRLATSTGPGSVLLQMTYDRWGNKSQAATGAGPHKPLSFLTGSYYKNRILSSGYTYDNAGNLTAEPADAWTGRGAMTYQYDAESRIKSTGGAATATYAYDGHGRRVKTTAGGQTRYTYYDPLGNPVWEYTTLWETYNLYFNGKLVFTNTAAMNPSTVWLHTDHLGTVRVKSNASGQAIAGTRLHYHPFGERTGAKTDPVKYEFTGKERDSDTRLDYFGARYYANTLGRFTAVDPADDSDPADPQRWNKYVYARNNPPAIVDRGGEAIETLWDLANIGIGVASLTPNVQEGNYAAAAIDAGGIVLDTVAAVLPFVPAGAGTAIKSVRAVDAGVNIVAKGGIKTNRAKGVAAEAKAAGELVQEGKTILGSQVGVQTKQGLRRVDHLTQSAQGQIVGVEGKTGKGTRTAAQRAKDAEIAEKGGKVVGKNAPENLRGRKVKFPTEERRYPD